MSTATATEVKAPWENWYDRRFEQYLHYECNGGYVLYTNDYIKLPDGALGAWEWVKYGNRPASLVITINWNSPAPKHHGGWSREAALAHMILHAEDGTHCSGADPQEWDAYERDVDTRSAARMGWTSWKALSLWDEELQVMVDIDPKTGRPIEPAHVVKKATRRRRTTSAARATAGRR